MSTLQKFIDVNNVTYSISGEWSVNGFAKVFNGKLLDENGIAKLNLNFSIPISAIQKFGLDYFEDCIENDLKKMIKNKI